MRLQTKIVIPMILVAAGPLALSGYSSLRLSSAELTRKIEELHDKSAQNQAEFIGNYLANALRGLRLGARVDYDEISLAEVAGALEALYLDFERLNLVGLRDEHGEAHGPDIFMDDKSAFDARYQAHEEVSRSEREEFETRVPIQTALRNGQAVGEVYTSPHKRWPMVALAVATPRRSGSWVHVAELSLADLQKRIASFAVGERGLAFVVDHQGRYVLHPDAELARSRADANGLSIVASGLAPNINTIQGGGAQGSKVEAYLDPERGEMLGAFAPVRGMGWGVVVAQPRVDALAGTRRMRNLTVVLLVLSLLVAIVLGVYSARGISRPVSELAAAALQVADGNFDLVIGVKSKDEVGELGLAFGMMVKRASLFFRYVDRNIVERLVREDRLALPGGEMKNIAILFGDMRDYTPMSNALTPDHTVRVLNAYFSMFFHVVHHFGGVVDKTMGDAIMAFFPQDLSGEDPDEYKLRSVYAVIYMKAASRVLIQYLRDREDLGAPDEIVAKEFGFAVASGPTIVGNIGSRDRMNYTVCGRVVNLAARLENMTRRGEVILDNFTSMTAERIALLRPLAAVQPKGFSDNERVVPSVILSLRPEHVEGLRRYMNALFSRDFVSQHLVHRAVTDPVQRSHDVAAAVEHLQDLANSAPLAFEAAGVDTDVTGAVAFGHEEQ